MIVLNFIDYVIVLYPVKWNNVKLVSTKGMDSLHPGAGTMRPVIISSLMTGGSVGGGGQTRLSIMSSVTLIIPERSGGSVLDERIIMHSANSSCRTLSRYIMSRSLTIAPFITIISSLLIIPVGPSILHLFFFVVKLSTGSHTGRFFLNFLLCTVQKKLYIYEWKI